VKHLFCASVLSLVLIVLFPTNSFALEMKPYAGGGLGFFRYDKVSDSAFGLYVSGGVDFPETKYFGAELRLGTALEAERSGFSGGTTNVSHYDLDYFLSALGKAKYAVIPEIQVYGLLGMTVASFSYDQWRGGVLQFSDSGTDVDVSIGFGADYRLRNEWLVGVEWVRYNSDVYSLVGTVRYEY